MGIADGQIDGAISTVEQNQTHYKLTVVIPKIVFNNIFKGRPDLPEDFAVTNTKEFKKFQEEYYEQMAAMSVGRIRFVYIDKT